MLTYKSKTNTHEYNCPVGHNRGIYRYFYTVITLSPPEEEERLSS